MTYPIRQPPDNDPAYAWTPDVRKAIAAANDHQTRITTLETAPPGGVTDHGALTGLTDDDHTQYLNQTRGDARYYTEAEITTFLAAKVGTTTGVTHIEKMTAAAYAGITPDANKIYVIVG